MITPFPPDFDQLLMSLAEQNTRIELLKVRNGHSARVTEIQGGNQMVRRMLSLGIRVGSIVDVLNHRGRGIVVGNSGTRVALGADIADKLIVEPISH